MSILPTLPASFFGMRAYHAEMNDWLNAVLWSDLHREVFGFRPKGPEHYPIPEKREEALEILYALNHKHIEMTRRRRLSNQENFEHYIMCAQHRLSLNYADAIKAYARETNCLVDNMERVDVDQLLYNEGLPFGLRESME